MNYCALLCLFFYSHAFCQHEVLGIGDPIIDLIYNIDENLLEKLNFEKGGSLKIDYSSFSTLLKILPSEPLKVVPGGSCSNTMKGLASLKHQSAFIGKIGKDLMGDQFSTSLTNYQVKPLLVASEKNTSQVASLVTLDGQRTMRCCLGAANDLQADEILKENFAGIQHLHMDGYILYNPNVALKGIEYAKQSGATVSIDLASFEVVKKNKDLIDTLLGKCIDIVFANEDEAKALTGLEPEAACYRLKEICPIAVILVGKEGCYVGSKDKVIHSPAFEVPIVDSTGAGDLFASGFLHGFLSHLPLEKCAEYGNRVGGTCVGTVGAELSSEAWQKIIQQMEHHDEEQTF